MTDILQENRVREGANYQGLFVLGESAYSWENEQGVIEHPDPEHHATGVVEWAIEAWEHERIPPFLACVTRALSGKFDPNERERRDAWDSCDFANYVTETVGLGAGNRPTPEMWEKAKKPFLALVEKRKPSRIIVTGKELWVNMPETAAHFCDDIQAYTLADGALAWAMCTGERRHLGWEKLARAIALFRSLNLPATMVEFCRVIGETR